ncbi:hypothetical protein [cyanobacterium endosymbiont of Rhopalodia gibberula]|uniref:hypothetical protein n=1 Tax=cyanobacterium endosymbiont of Rhopalodia gibberula TaxID=1763363 RepID=UPI002680D7C6
MHVFIPPKYLFTCLTWTDTQEMLDLENIVMVEAAGKIRQHSVHLPTVDVKISILLSLLQN